MAATRAVALLRGVNVGGRGVLPMAGLRDSVASLGYGNVATFIQSGNVVFDTDGPAGQFDRGAVEQRIRSVVAERHGLDVAVMVRLADELDGILGPTRSRPTSPTAPR